MAPIQPVARVHLVRRTVWFVLLLPATLVAAGGCCNGTAGRCMPRALHDVLDRIPSKEKDSEWIMRAVAAYDGDCLISLRPPGGWTGTVLRVMRVVGDQVICDVHERSILDEVSHRRAYAISDPYALEMFHSLYDQVALGYTHRTPDFECSPHPHGWYLISIGRRCGVTWDEGAYGPTRVVIGQLAVRDYALSAGDEPPELDFGVYSLRPNAFDSVAAYIILAVDSFDTTCELVYAAQGGISNQLDE